MSVDEIQVCGHFGTGVDQDLCRNAFGFDKLAEHSLRFGVSNVDLDTGDISGPELAESVEGNQPQQPEHDDQRDTHGPRREPDPGAS